MGIARKILIFMVLTAGIIVLGRLAGRLLPRSAAASAKAAPASADTLRDSTNALPPVEADTTGGKWHDKLFDPLLRSAGLPEKNIKRKTGYWEITFPKGRPIHEYALEIEKTCKAGGIQVLAGAELRPPNRSVEYLLASNGQNIKLRASLGAGFMAGAAKLAIVFNELDSLRETQAAELESAPWDKSLVVDPYAENPALRKLRFTDARNEILIALPMEPAAYPFVDPGKHALFIHHGKDDVERILSQARDSLPKAAGFATRYGDRAIENQPLLDKVFQYTARRNLVFLDLTGSQRSLARQTAAAQGARNRTLAQWKDSLHLEDELARKVALAQKTGDAVLALPYSVTGFRNLRKALDANAERFNEMGLELVTLSSLATPDSLPDPDLAAPAAAKPPHTVPAPAVAPAKTSDKRSGVVAKTPAKTAAKTTSKTTAQTTDKTTAKTVVKPAVKPATKTAVKTAEKAKPKPVKKAVK